MVNVVECPQNKLIPDITYHLLGLKKKKKSLHTPVKIFVMKNITPR